jgi:hypothetical protein
MPTKGRRGVSCIEFAFSTLVSIPLLLGTGAIGVNMIRTLQTIQLARDAGHMYARNIDFAQPGNKTVLVNIGRDLGLSSTAGEGTAAVILSALTYVDRAACAAEAAVDASGNPTAACTNFGRWVFTQRIVIGNSAVRNSNYGGPLTTGPTGVTLDSSGKITRTQYVKQAGAVASFSGMNPYSVVAGVAQGLPSGQVLYIAEAAARGFNMPPFVSGAVAYSWGMF